VIEGPWPAAPRGDALPAAATRRLGTALGLDVAGARLHADGGAETADALGARAWTFGADIAFAPGQYRPGTAAGRRLLAHELVHVAQQRSGAPRLQRSPYGVEPAEDEHEGSAGMHEQLGRAYAAEHAGEGGDGGVSPGAVQYSPAYAGWLQAKSASAVRFLPTRFVTHDPLPQRGEHPPRVNGETHLEVNGSRLAGADIGQQLADLSARLTPTAITTTPGLIPGQLRCRFDPAVFRIDAGAVVDELSRPAAAGWTGRVNPADFPPPPGSAPPAACAGKTAVPATLTGPSGAMPVWQMVHDAELEHVDALRALHQRYLVPYYHEVLALESVGGDTASCRANLATRLGRRAEQAALDFVVGDIAAQQTLDDAALGTHFGRVTATPDAACNSMAISATPMTPRQPGSAPGNVMPVAPRVVSIDGAQLSVAGSTLSSAGRTVRVFASAADAATAMGVLATLGVTELHSFGSVDMLMAGSALATGPVTGLPALRLDPARLQVMPPLVANGEWALGHANGDQLLKVVGFGNTAAGRDLAYAAAARLTALGARHQFAVDAGANPVMVAYTA
jgi:hypothetical protein